MLTIIRLLGPKRPECTVLQHCLCRPVRGCRANTANNAADKIQAEVQRKTHKK